MFLFGKKNKFNVMNNFDAKIKNASWQQVQEYIDRMMDDDREFITLEIEKPVSEVSYVQAAWNQETLLLEVGLKKGNEYELKEKNSNIDELKSTLEEFYNTGKLEDVASFKKDVKPLPCIIGTGKPHENDRYKFESEMREYLVAIGGQSAYGSGSDDGYRASCSILGYVDLGTGKTSDVRSSLSFVPTDDERENRTFFDYFNKLTIYRIKALAAKLIDGDPWVNNAFRMGGLFGVEMLSVGDHDAFLEELIEKYKTPVTFKTEHFGELLLDKDLHIFEGEFDWLGVKAKLLFNVEEDPEDAKEALEHMESFYKEAADWDKRMREYAADELTDLANEWRTSDWEIDEDGELVDFVELTKEDFAGNLEIDSIEMDKDGNFSVFYNDGDMFFGHSILVDGNLESGIDSASMQG